MQNAARQLDTKETARVIGHVQLDSSTGTGSRNSGISVPENRDDFFTTLNAASLGAGRIQRELERVLAEIESCRAETGGRISSPCSIR